MATFTFNPTSVTYDGTKRISFDVTVTLTDTTHDQDKTFAFFSTTSDPPSGNSPETLKALDTILEVSSPDTIPGTNSATFKVNLLEATADIITKSENVFIIVGYTSISSHTSNMVISQTGSIPVILGKTNGYFEPETVTKHTNWWVWLLLAIIFVIVIIVIVLVIIALVRGDKIEHLLLEERSHIYQNTVNPNGRFSFAPRPDRC